MTAIDGSERDFWERRAAAWERRTDSMEQFSAAHGGPAMDRLGAQPGERIADIGCGPGTTVVELARRVAPGGEVLAVDISPGMIAAAERRVGAEGIEGVSFAVADLEEAPIGADLDGLYSRFGLMFFDDPPAAFANLAASLRPGGRLGCAVWSELGENPWMFVPTLAAVLTLGADPPIPAPGEPGPFSLADEGELRAMLAGAGFANTRIEVVRHPRVLHSSTVEDEVRSMLEVGPIAEAFESADDDSRRATIAAVVEAIEPYAEGDGWSIPGASLVVTARLPD